MRSLCGPVTSHHTRWVGKWKSHRYACAPMLTASGSYSQYQSSESNVAAQSASSVDRNRVPRYNIGTELIWRVPPSTYRFSCLYVGCAVASRGCCFVVAQEDCAAHEDNERYWEP